MLYTDILTKNRDFQLCYQKGRSIISRFVIVYARKNRFGINRLGITTGKKVGNAVARSRARRLIRQAWRENEPDAPVGLDIVIVARAALPGVKSDVLSHWLHKYGIPGLHKIYAGEDPMPPRPKPNPTQAS
ncbi:MAG: ribonuclease P protein component [Oscillospiraceae bacterium]|nr:ribonuclease P protein component [Oscillospiraceae bacterium]MBQ9696316.1 ribonuclease P protein component [Oscillospiraceae bacterium]MBR1459834.1 ribonuclease P protein component [Oscillospiraceae bacterium]MBR1899250.1 ribonuclease P protein component [Oscillospiraceae bacterium]